MVIFAYQLFQKQSKTKQDEKHDKINKGFFQH